MSEPHSFLVVHRVGGASTVLARLIDPPRHFTALEPFASRLRLDGRAAGEVVLMREAGRHVVARYRLDRPPTARAWTTPPTRRVPRPRPAPRPAHTP